MILRQAICALALTVLTIGSSSAQTDPIKLVVGFAPGGGVDTLARITARSMSETLGRPIVIENKSGAGGTLAADYVARSNPDGLTLLFGDTSLVVAPHVYPSVRYDISKDFAPVGIVGQSDLAIAVPSNSPAQTVAELLALAKDKPDYYSYASVGVGSLHHLAGELLALQTDTKLMHVPYRGGSQASQALAAGEVSMAIASLASAVPLEKSGHIRILATLSEKRFPGSPDLPVIGETISGYQATPSLFVLAPAGTSEQALAPISAALEKAMQDPAVQASFLAQGSVAAFEPAAEQALWLKSEGQRWANVIDRASIKFN